MQAYVGENDTQRQKIAAQYLNTVPASDLLDALEQKYPLCNTEAHPLGRAVFDRTQNLSAAIAQCGTKCSDGCFHGAMMEMFSTQNDTFGGLVNDADPESVLADVESLAHDLCFKPEVAKFIALSPCIHGLGHVFIYLSNYDLKGALAACKSLGSSARASDCAGGVFMEFMSHSADDPRVSGKEYYPCDEFSAYSVSCYRYKASSMLTVWGDKQEALGACEALDTNSRLACIRGVGHAVSIQQKITMPSTDDFWNICGSVETSPEHQACVKGVIDNVLINVDPASLESACGKMPVQYRPTCLQIAHAIKNLN